jgi:type III secretory pathway lipoprotein EscJ
MTMFTIKRLDIVIDNRVIDNRVIRHTTIERLFIRYTLISLMALSLLACDDSPLYSTLTEQQANEIEAALLTVHIDARKKPSLDGEHWTITVPREEIP